VRLHPGDAAKLFALVKAEGMGNTRIAVTGGNPVAVARRFAPRERLEAYDDDDRPPPRLRRVRQRDEDYGRPAYYDAYRSAPVYYHVPYSYMPYGSSWQNGDDD
jgi:hypothetical protein